MTEPRQERTPLVILDEFLVAQEWAGLLRHALDRRSDFGMSGVLDNGGVSRTDSSYRRSRRLGLHGSNTSRAI